MKFYLSPFIDLMASCYESFIIQLNRNIIALDIHGFGIRCFDLLASNCKGTKHPIYVVNLSVLFTFKIICETCMLIIIYKILLPTKSQNFENIYYRFSGSGISVKKKTF